MTREHLTEDIRNVLQLARPPIAPSEAPRVRNAFLGLYRHIRGEPDVPERVQGCLAESIRFLESLDVETSDDTWDYARTCLEAALDFAQEARPLVAQPAPPA